MRTPLAWAVILVVISAGGCALWWQHESQVHLQEQLQVLGRQDGERVRLQEANRRLAETLPTAVEMEKLRTNRTAISQLSVEIAALRGRERSAAEESAQRSSSRFAAGDKVPAGAWANAGRATSRAALETVLWAAAGGDIERFANCLVLSDRSRQLALQLRESLPPELREQCGTPERLIALLACKDVPLGAAKILAWDQVKTPTSSEQVRLQLSTPDGATRDLLLRFAQQSDGWKLVMPDAAMAKYYAMVKGPASPPGATRSTGKAQAPGSE